MSHKIAMHNHTTQFGLLGHLSNIICDNAVEYKTTQKYNST